MIDRRTFIQSAPVAMAASTSLADEPNQLDYNAAVERVRYFASIIGKDAPTRLLDIDEAPSSELLAFCSETGMSLDWVFLGDLKPMVLASYHERTGKPADRTPIEALFSRWEKASAEYECAADEFDALLSQEKAAGVTCCRYSVCSLALMSPGYSCPKEMRIAGIAGIAARL